MSVVAIVDDDEDFVSAVATVLRSAGHEVDVALETRGVVERLERRRPDIIVLDVMFPEDNNAGFDLARRLRDPGSGLKEIPILMLTAINQESPIRFSSGDIDETWLPVTDFLEKPVDLDVLREKVEAMLQTARLA